MKQVLKFVAISFAILAFAACAEESKETPVSFTRKLTFTATREGLSPESKSVRMEDGSTWWNENEEISVFYGSGSAGGSKFTTQNNMLQDVVEFSGSVQMSGSGKDFWAVYPYSEENECDGSSITTVIPAVQTASEGNFSDDVFPAIAKTKTTEFAFWNICGGIKFFVSRSDIKSVTIKGNGGEALAGKVKVACNADGHPEVTEVIESETEVTLVAPDGGCFKPGKYYYITLLPIALDGGITLTFYTSSEKGEIVSDKAQTIKRSIFGILKKVDSAVTEWENTVVEPEYVDLGLSVKWASFNVGATKPEEYGDYFALGEIEQKSDYNWSTYKWCNGGNKSLTKYCSSSQPDYWDGSGAPDNKTVLDPEDDAARANWGNSWRMPTFAEWSELKENCTCTWTSNYNGTGIAGQVVSSSNGNSIFLPAAGSRVDANLKNVGSTGGYWSSFLISGIPTLAGYISLNSDGLFIAFMDRYYGFSVRPVYEEFIPVSSITLDKSSLELIVGASVQLTATISPSDATAQSVRWESEDYSVVSVDQNGNISAIAEGSTTITAYASNGLSATCAVTVSKEPQPEAVDLGLSVKWASFNVGANAPEVFGDLFAWGETTPRPASSFTQYWAAYKWCNGSGMSLTKYCYEQNYGQVDNKTVLEPEDDAATVNVGSDWRTPTSTEIDELLNKCSWEYTTLNDVPGYRVSSLVSGYTDKSIFLPFPIFDNDLYKDLGCTPGTLGLYWSSSLFPQLNQHPSVAYCLAFLPSDVLWDCLNRFAGFPIRPVYGEFIPVSSITLDKSSLELMIGDSAQLNATISPSIATAPSVRWVSSNGSIVSFLPGGRIEAISVGEATITAYSSNGLSASCKVKVVYPELTELGKTFEAVDLGLSVKWATFNVGATKPEEYGDYYAWGETEPKEEYSWATYIWCTGSHDYLLKYNTDYSYGTVDNKTTLDFKDDAASVNLGGTWRMPTFSEQDELVDMCTWNWTSQSGVNGYEVTGPNGNSIFLPAAGEYLSSLNDVGIYGNYWSSSLFMDFQVEGDACNISFYPDAIGRGDLSRCSGFSVRPVCPKE